MHSSGVNLNVQQNAALANMDKTVKRDVKHVQIRTVVVSMARALLGVLQDIPDQKLDVPRDVCMEHSYLTNAV